MLFFFLKKGLLARVPWARLHFLHFIFFQTVFSVLSSSSDASTYFKLTLLFYYAQSS